MDSVSARGVSCCAAHILRRAPLNCWARYAPWRRAPTRVSRSLTTHRRHPPNRRHSADDVGYVRGSAVERKTRRSSETAGKLAPLGACRRLLLRLRSITYLHYICHLPLNTCHLPPDFCAVCTGRRCCASCFQTGALRLQRLDVVGPRHSAHSGTRAVRA